MPELAQPTIFDDIYEKNVIILIDTSGSMYSRLNIVKSHLKEFLHRRAFKGGYKFNLVEFNSSVTQWADKLVRCLPETVNVAYDWINSLEAKTGTNTESALLSAYNDDECDAIYLVTDGLPDSKPSDILDIVAYVCNGRPCHCIYLTGATVDKAATDFLQDLATETFGSFTIVTVTNHGSVDRITPVYKASHAKTGVIRTTNKEVYDGTQKQCSVTTTLGYPPASTTTVVQNPVLPQNPYALPVVPSAGGVMIPPVSAIEGPHPNVLYPNPYALLPGPRVYTEDNGRVLRVPYFNHAWAQWYQPYLWARYRTARSWLKLSKDLDGAISSMSMSPAAGSLLIDQPTLSRRTADGYYYRSKVKSQISTDRFLVEFAPCLRGDYQETEYQETFVFDIVQLNDAKRHSIMKGDKVLAPVEGNPDKYGPATVIDGQEGRESTSDIAYKELIVMFTTGKTACVEAGEAVWVDQLLYDRTSFELNLPKKTRQNIVDTVAGYPENSLPGYPVSGSEKDPVEWEFPRKYQVSGHDETFQPSTGVRIHRENFEDYRPYLKDHSKQSYVTKEEVELRIPGTNLTQDELRRKVDAQIRASRRDLDEHDRVVRDDILMSRRRREVDEKNIRHSMTLDDIDKDISVLEAELKYKMKLKDQAIEEKKRDIDSDIELKIIERDRLMEERRLLLGYPAETRLSRERSRLHRRRSSPTTSLERERSLSRDGYRYRSRSRSLSNERAPSYGRVSPRLAGTRCRSLSPRASRSVNFDEDLNRVHHYRYNNMGRRDYFIDSGYSDSDEVGKRDASTSTPLVRNGREIKLKKNKDERPPWRYWKAEPIPDVMDPPYHEPYDQGAIAEPLELRDHNIRTGVVEWNNSHFNKVVPNGRTNYDRFLSTPPNTTKSVSFQDNSNSHVAPGSNLVTHESNNEKKLRMRQNESQRRIQTMSPATYYMNGDSVGQSMQDFHRQQIFAQMQREAASKTAFPSKRGTSLSSINKSSKLGTREASQPNNTYQMELNSTSYQRELNHHNRNIQRKTPEQKRLISLSAKRQQRELLHVAQLQQKENQEQANLMLKRDRAASRNAEVTQNIFRDIAKESRATVATA